MYGYRRKLPKDTLKYNFFAPKTNLRKEDEPYDMWENVKKWERKAKYAEELTRWHHCANCGIRIEEMDSGLNLKEIKHDKIVWGDVGYSIDILADKKGTKEWMIQAPDRNDYVYCSHDCREYDKYYKKKTPDWAAEDKVKNYNREAMNAKLRSALK
jgi:hypothetical protein